MNPHTEQRIREEYGRAFTAEFSHRFLDIAILADKRDAEGYGKGIARLQNDVEDWSFSWFFSRFATALEEERRELREKIEDLAMLKTPDGYATKTSLARQIFYSSDDAHMYNVALSKVLSLLTPLE